MGAESEENAATAQRHRRAGWAWSIAEVLLRLILPTGTLTVILQVAFVPLPSFAVQVIVAVPLALKVTLPAEVTVATLVLLLLQVTSVDVASSAVASPATGPSSSVANF